MATKWNTLNVHEKIDIVCKEICQQLQQMQVMTAPLGEVDSSFQSAIESFDPILKHFITNYEEADKDDDNSAELSSLVPDINELQTMLTNNISPSPSKMEDAQTDISSRSKEKPINMEDAQTDIPSRSKEKPVNMSKDKHVSNRTRSKIAKLSDSISEVEKFQVAIHSLVINQPGPSGMQLRKTTKRSSGSVYESMTNYRPRMEGDTDDKSNNKRNSSTIY